MKRFACLALFFLLIPLFAARAQTGSPDEVISSGIVISINPEHPGSDTKVDARVTSSTADLDQSTITWRVNGKVITSGRGVKSASFVTNPTGSPSTVSVTVDAASGTYTKSLVVENNSVDLLWQGEGYTPPFYHGRSLWSYLGRVTVYAIPHVAGRSAQNLSFKWTVNGEVYGQSSGEGKDSLILFDTILSLPQEVQVDVMTDDDTVAATASATLTPQAPEVHVYENSPLLGYVFEREAVGTMTLAGKEVTFAAFPFYFSTSRRANSSLSYAWSTNSGASQSSSEVTYRAPEGSGSSRIDASIHSLTQALQSADADFLVQFGNDNAQ